MVISSGLSYTGLLQRYMRLSIGVEPTQRKENETGSVIRLDARALRGT